MSTLPDLDRLSNDELIAYLDDYVHDTLPEWLTAEQIERRCAHSPVLQAALEEAQRRLKTMQSVPPEHPSDALIKQTVDRIERFEQVSRPRRRRLAVGGAMAVAASVLVLVGMNIYYASLQPSPFDLRVLGQTTWMPGTTASLRVALYDQRSGQPVDDVPIVLTLASTDAAQGRVELADFRSDTTANGRQFEVPAWDDGDYRLTVTAQTPGGASTITRDVALRRSWKLMLSTDKPIYQPGQTVHLRSLALRRPDLKPVAGQATTFEITDPKGNLIFRQRDVTSRFGIASTDCPLAAEILQGSYTIACTVGDSTSERTVKVEKYTLPKFKAEIVLDRPYYQPGQRVRGTIDAAYFFGKPVADGTVAIDVFSDGFDQQQLHEEETTTDDAGRATLEFTLPERMFGRVQQGGAAQFTAYVSVTDTAGQQYAARQSAVVTEHPIQLEIVPESGTLVRGVSNRLFALASYADGRPAEVRLVVAGNQGELQTSPLGVASWEITPQQERVELTIKATDAEGMVGRRQMTLQCGQVAGDFLIRTDRATYDGGATMTVAALGGGVEPVMLDFIKDGQSVLSQTVEMTDGAGQAVFDLPAELFGTIEVCAYRFGVDGLPVRKSRTVYVSQVRQLAIATSLDREQYRPGERAVLQFELTDDQGRPAPGALSLAAVDEAVFAVLGRQVGLERTFFLLEQELLEPVLVRYGWSPDLETSVDDPVRWEFEAALFSRTAGLSPAQRGWLEELVAEYGQDGEWLDLLRQPNWESAVVGRWLPSAMRERLIEQFSPHSLSERSFPVSQRETQQRQRRGLHMVRQGWVGLGGLLTAAAVLWAVIKSVLALRAAGRLLEGVVAVALIMLLIGLLLPAGGGGLRNAMMPMAAMDTADGADMDEMVTQGITAEAPTTPTGLGAAPPRVRQWFPETLLWRPELVTDDQGRATLEVDLADSITNWRLSASAVSASGQLGAAEQPINVFQPFFVDLDLPVALTRHDEVSIRAAVYNYADAPQSVTLTLDAADWFEPTDTSAEPLTLEVAPGEIRSVYFPIRVLQVGEHALEVTATAGDVADAVRRTIEVVPNGRRVEQTASGTLDTPAEMTIDIPADAIEGSVGGVVKLYPSTFSQLVEGLDAIFRMPSGCFEQTSSTTYPNVLALDYLRKTEQSVPEVEAKARQYVNVGYQRLISFEVDGGGFDWFGRPPANQTLTAYGLMEFEDMARVHDVDPKLIDRTRQWLLRKRQRDGSWGSTVNGMLDDGLAGSLRRGELVRLAETAYIAWAVFRDGQASDAAGTTLGFLLSHEADAIDDPYIVALVANAVAAIDPGHRGVASYLDRLLALKSTSDDGKLVWWEQPTGARTTFYGAGRSGDVEATALAVLALLTRGEHAASVNGALAWLVAQKDPHGTWYSTQATVLSLKALLAATGQPTGERQPREIEIALDGQTIRTLSIPVDQADVMQQIDLAGELTRGQHRLTIVERTDTAAGFQIAVRHFVDDGQSVAPSEEPLSVEIVYDRQRLQVDQTVTATATIANRSEQSAPMLILDLPIPGGFTIEPGELDELAGSQRIARYQITPRKAIVYLRDLPAGATLELRYRLRATMPVKVTAPPAEAYEYYDPDRRGRSQASRLEVVEA